MIRVWLALAIGLALTACGPQWDKDPLSVYQIDPAAFGIPLTTLYSLGF